MGEKSLVELKEEFKEKAGNQKFKVTFIKKDGSERVMCATTNIELIPEDKRPKQKEYAPEELEIIKEREEKSPYINVWDTTAEGWRKINVTKIIGEIEQFT